jgi:hypothetical protein
MRKNNYYTLLAGLPDMDFSSAIAITLPVLYPDGELDAALSSDDLELVKLLYYSKLHDTIVARHEVDSPENASAGTQSGVDEDELMQEPEYVRHWLAWKEEQGRGVERAASTAKLLEFWFLALRTSGNRFLQLWGESEQNLLNFLAARRAESTGRLKRLVHGNDYAVLLEQFSVSQRICLTEFDMAEKVENAMSQEDIFKREMQLDRLRWDRIDDINRFEYFSIDVVLGYCQKAMLLQRWQRITNPDTPVNLVGKSEEIISDMVKTDVLNTSNYKSIEY